MWFVPGKQAHGSGAEIASRARSRLNAPLGYWQRRPNGACFNEPALSGLHMAAPAFTLHSTNAIAEAMSWVLRETADNSASLLCVADALGDKHQSIKFWINPWYFP
jgi:hypothetical protein